MPHVSFCIHGTSAVHRDAAAPVHLSVLRTCVARHRDRSVRSVDRQVSVVGRHLWGPLKEPPHPARDGRRLALALLCRAARGRFCADVFRLNPHHQRTANLFGNRHAVALLDFAKRRHEFILDTECGSGLRRHWYQCIATGDKASRQVSCSRRRLHAGIRSASHLLATGRACKYEPYRGFPIPWKCPASEGFHESLQHTAQRSPVTPIESAETRLALRSSRLRLSLSARSSCCSGSAYEVVLGSPIPLTPVRGFLRARYRRKRNRPSSAAQWPWPWTNTPSERTGRKPPRLGGIAQTCGSRSGTRHSPVARGWSGRLGPQCRA